MTSVTEWPEVGLGEVCEFKYGKSLPAANREPGAFSVYGSNGVVGEHSEALTRGPTIIVGRKGSFGEVNYSDSPCWPIDTTYFVDATSTKADLRWLAHLLPTLRLTELNRAAAVPGLNREDAYRRRCLLPPIDEQRRIAAILDQADVLRAKRREAIAHLDDLATSIFLDMFGDPSTARGHDWELTTIGAVADIQGGLTVNSARKRNPIEVPYLRVANVHRGRLELAEIKTLRATEREIDRTRLQLGDLLVVEGHGNADEIGRGALWDGSIEGCVHQNHLIRVRFDRRSVLPVYGSGVINSQGGRRHLLRAGKTTSGLNTISVSDVRSTPIATPPVRLQETFVHRIDGIGSLQVSQQQAVTHLDALFASLQARAFAGGL